MKVTVAIDSFKGSLSSLEAGNAAKGGILQAYPDAEVSVCPVADGGEGTMEALVSAGGGQWIEITVSDPLARPIKAKYGYLPHKKTAVIEMAEAAGITRISAEERDPMKTTTYGVGEMIADAIDRGCRRFIVGIGGSATNDGGVGMLQALGFAFFDNCGKQISRGAMGLSALASIDDSAKLEALSECSFLVACDVKNPLCGELGCSAVYGPQKGASAEQIKEMDGWLKGYAELTQKIIPSADPDFAGAGAAGGMGFALMSYLNARLVSGVELVLCEIGAEREIALSDVVVTGEGRLDGQSCMGKLPVGVAGIAKKYGKACVAFSGAVSEDAGELNSYGIDAFFPILRSVCTLEDAMKKENAAQNLCKTAEQAFRLIKTMKGD